MADFSQKNNIIDTTLKSQCSSLIQELNNKLQVKPMVSIYNNNQYKQIKEYLEKHKRLSPPSDLKSILIFNENIVRKYMKLNKYTGSISSSIPSSIPSLIPSSIPSSIPKIFQIGFNKCGTRSIYTLFKENDIPSIRYDLGKLAIRMKKNFKYKLPLLNGYDNIILFTDMENIDHYRLPFYAHVDLYKILDKQYPKSKIILNIRNKDDWIISRLNHSNGGYAKISAKKYKLFK